MPNVLELTRQLTGPNMVIWPAGVQVRTFGQGCAEDDDVAGWLELRRRAFADQQPTVRHWTAVEFVREFIDKPWWDPLRCWLAWSENIASPIGSVMLAMRCGKTHTQAVLHWLMVDPIYRGRGIGRALVGMAENRAWQLGHSTLAVETHVGWQASVALYRWLQYQ